LLAGRWRKLRWAPFAWLGLLGLPLVRNRKYPSPRAVVVEHIIAGASVLIETFRRIIGEMDPVVFLPDDETPYLRHLADALTEQGTPVDFWRGPTKSATLNILLGPPWAILQSWRGVRIVHIHWTFGFSRSSRGFAGLFARWWFEVFLRVARVSGLRVVWTAHNILPHEAVFDNDLTARRVLASRADAIIALSPHGALEVCELFRVGKVTVIPHGPLEITSSPAGRDGARSGLDIGPRPCFTFFGQLRPYKGLETLIDAAKILGPSVAVRIAGRGDATYVANITRMIAAANSAGADIQLDPRWRSDAELADLLAASDVCVFPFTRVDNSSSVLLALTTGLPIIIPDLASLQHIDNSGVLRYDGSNPVRALSDAMTTAANLSHAERMAMGCAAREWALKFNWATIAEETAAVYAQTVRGK
jgi:glycosyltransferase involved in cell wall biosynthesis